MLFYDVDKDVSVFAMGKHGTRSMIDIISRAYTNVDVKLAPDIKINLNGIDPAIPPIYAMGPDHYVNTWRRGNYASTNYVIIRRPFDRFRNGLITNMLLHAKNLYGEEIYRTNSSIPEDIYNLLTEKSIFDVDNGTYSFHIGPYLHLMLSQTTDTIFVPLHTVSKLWKELLNVTTPKLNHLSYKKPVNQYDVLINNALIYFAEKMNRNDFPKEFMDTYTAENNAYHYILSNCKIYE